MRLRAGPATVPSLPVAWTFIVAAGAWSLVFAGALRTSVVTWHVVLPLTRLQADLATWYAGPPRGPITVTLDCSGADVIALVLAVSLAYPVTWGRRAVGAAGGLGVVLALNTLRIAMLGRTADSPLFIPLHRVVWPGLLILGALVYMGAWIRWAERKALDVERPGGDHGPLARWGRWAVVTVGLHVGLAPWLGTTRLLQAAAGWAAGGAAAVLSLTGATVLRTDAFLTTRHGTMVVTPECILTPVLPLYVAAALAWPRSRGHRALAVLAGVPLFAGLAILRLLTVAVPPFITASPLVLTHAFYQILLGALVVIGAALWRTPSSLRMRAGRVGLALGTGLVLATTVGALYARGVTGLAVGLAGRLPPDPHEAVRTLPPYQLALFVALWIAVDGFRSRWRFGLGLTVLSTVQIALLAGLSALWTEGGVIAPEAAVRALALAAPVVVLMAAKIGSVSRPRRYWGPGLRYLVGPLPRQ